MTDTKPESMPGEAAYLPPASLGPISRVQPCGCILCVCQDDEQCHGCGARRCNSGNCVLDGDRSRVVRDEPATPSQVLGPNTGRIAHMEAELEQARAEIHILREMTPIYRVCVCGCLVRGAIDHKCNKCGALASRPLDVAWADREALTSALREWCNETSVKVGAFDDLLAACEAVIAWGDAEKDAKPYADDGGAAFYRRQKLCVRAFDLTRDAVAKAKENADEHTSND